MRVLVCGDRNWTNRRLIYNRLRDFPPYTTLIEGEARGADKLSADVGMELQFHVIQYPADWAKYGRAAGPIRNMQMLKEGKPDLVIAFHNDLASSKGTKNMVKIAMEAGIPVEVITE